MVWKIDSSGNCIFSYFCFFLSLLFVLLLEGQGLLCIIFLTSVFFFPPLSVFWFWFGLGVSGEIDDRDGLL